MHGKDTQRRSMAQRSQHTGAGMSMIRFVLLPSVAFFAASQ
jgi:hypothetical protein